MKLVGEAYVHGFMDGEAITKLKSGNMEGQWYHLTNVNVPR